MTPKEIEYRIVQSLKDMATQEQIEGYISDIHAFSDIYLYDEQYMTSEEIYFDFVDWAQLDY
jgi:hypothetical protein